MENLLKNRLSGLETAITTLLDSITLYNPSPVAASDLVAADDELNIGLEMCKSHNFFRENITLIWI